MCGYGKNTLIANEGNMKATFKSTAFNRQHHLELSDKEIVFEKGSKNRIVLQVNDDLSFKFGIDSIRGFEFPIGRVYSIDIQDSNNRTVKIRMKTLYGMGNKSVSEKFNLILDKLFKLYYTPMYYNKIDQILNNETIEVCGCLLTKEGIRFDKRAELIRWESIDSGKFNRYYSITSKENTSKYKMFYFLHDWNAYLLILIADHFATNQDSKAE